MSPSRFDQYFEWLIPWEGSQYENDPADPGGATKYGIDQRSHPDVNIRRLTRSGAKQLYYSDYWLAIRGDDLPTRLDWVVMDIAVNNGRTRAIQWLQEAVKTDIDGILGPVTLGAVLDANVEDLRTKLLLKRETFYKRIANGARAKFLAGWLNRNASLEAATRR